MIKILLGLGVFFYFATRLFLWLKYQRNERKLNIKDTRAIVFLAVDFLIVTVVAYQLNFPHVGEMKLLQFAKVVEFSGIFLFIVGVSFSSWGRLAMGKSWGPAITSSGLTPEQSLVTSAPFSIVRHPIYSGMILMGFGFELALVNWLFLAIIPLVYLLYWQAKLEERFLLERFPREYKNYKKKISKMFFPGIF